jgi:hypothetical protein
VYPLDEKLVVQRGQSSAITLFVEWKILQKIIKQVEFSGKKDNKC